MARAKRTTTTAKKTAFTAAASTAKTMSKADVAGAERNQQDREQRSFVSLSQLKQREQNTREINNEHVEALIESIRTIGLLEPLVVDNRYRLLAGGHRLKAILAIAQGDPQGFAEIFPESLVPVRIMPFDANEDVNKALECEVAENEKRRDYTPSEVRSWASRLIDLGYIHERGRPKGGVKPVVPALQVIVGKSRATIQRYLSQQNDENVGGSENVSNETIMEEKKLLNAAWKKLKTFQKMHQDAETTPKRALLLKKIPNVLDRIEDVLGEIDAH